MGWVFLIVSAVGVPVQSQTPGWPGFLGPQRTGVSTERGLNWDWKSRPPEMVWSLEIGEGYGAGSVANGRYYHFDRIGNESRLRCVSLDDGTVRWTWTKPTIYQDMYGYDGGPRASPLLDDGRVVVFDVDGILAALDAETGELLWEVDTAKRFGVIQNFFGAGSSPVSWGDHVIAVVGGSPPESANVPRGQLDWVVPNGTGVVAFDKATGDEVYRMGDDLAAYASPVIAEIEGQPTGLALLRSGLWVFDPETGHSLWRFPWRARKLESVNASTPVVTPWGILITESYGPGGALLPARRTTEGPVQPIWDDSQRRDKSMACHWCTPIVIGEAAFLCSGEKKSTCDLRCVRIRDGEVLWRSGGHGRCSLLYCDGHLVCQEEDGGVFCFAPTVEGLKDEVRLTGDQFRQRGPCWAAPLIADGILVVRDRRQVTAFDLRRDGD